MSDSRNVKLYIEDIIDSGAAILSFVEGMSIEDFMRDRKTYSATIREFEVIGEAVSKLPDEIKNKYPQVEWRDIKDFRNILIHEYFGVDLEFVWNVIQNDLPVLLECARKIIRELEEGD